MRIIKSASLGFLQKPFRYRQRHHLAVSALGFFSMTSSGERFLPELAQWPLVMAALPPNEPLDFAMPKARGEMLLAASAYAPPGKPVTQMTVRAVLDTIDKSLLVIGDREWLYGLMPLYSLTDAKPFTEMPITYARAFGGRRYAANPLGTGYLGRGLPALLGVNRGTAWNIEHPHEPVRSPRKRYQPAGFGPLDIRCPARQAKAGTYGRRWLEQDFPGLPEDLDWSLFNASPPDQQIDGYFKGGEAYRLEGMHPAKAVIEGRLPQLRARAFVHRKGSAADEAEEIPLVCDTVWFFPARELGVMIYRGQAAIHDSDALDVESVMLAYEASSAEPRSLEHYRQTLRLRVDPATAALQALNDSPLTPVPSEAERTARALRRVQLEADDMAKRQALLDESAADFWRKSGKQPPPNYQPPKAKPRPLPSITAEAITQGEVDLVDFVAKARALAEESRKQGAEKLEKVVPPSQQSVRSPDTIAAQLKEARARADVAARDLVETSGQPKSPGSTRMKRGIANEAGQAKKAEQSDLPALRRRGRRAAPKPLFPKQPLFPEVARKLGDLLREWHSRGVCLAGRDMAGARLAGMNFAGADLREAMLEQADLSQANFRGANLEGAILTASCLEGADFTGANLSRATLSLARAQRACFREACLESVMLSEACFNGADFSQASLIGVIALKTELTGATLAGCDLSRAVLTQARADEADFSNSKFVRTLLLDTSLRRACFAGATVESSALLNVKAEHSIWRGSRLTRVHAGGRASFVAADLRDMIASQCGFRGADLSGADFSRSRFAICDFGTCRLDGANLTGALLWRSIFMQASLRNCILEQANFLQAMCRKVDLRGSSLSAAHLLQADLSEAQLEDPLIGESAA
jgi:uncharacterized protein YjbI with pentapeptide repeats